MLSLSPPGRDPLAGWWYSKNPGPFSRVVIVDDLVEFYDGDKRTVRRLSAKGKEYLRNNGPVLVGEEEDHLEPDGAGERT